MIPLGCDGGLHIKFTSVLDTTLVLNSITPGVNVENQYKRFNRLCRFKWDISKFKVSMVPKLQFELKKSFVSCSTSKNFRSVHLN